MKNLAPIISLVLTIVILQLLRPTLNKFFSRPGAQERRIAKAKLPSWLKFLELILFIVFWVGITLLVMPHIINGHLPSMRPGFQGIEIFLFLISIVPIAGLLCNLVLWLIPPARRVSQENAKGIPGASFSESNIGLAKFLLVMAVVWIIFLGIYFLV